jgi:hypothetical protein
MALVDAGEGHSIAIILDLPVVLLALNDALD